jgi:hypothetical protein
MVDNIQNKYTDLLNRNKQIFGQIFQGPFLTSPSEQAKREWGVMPTGRDLLRDVRSQVTQFQRFQGALNRLSRRGAPVELINQLREAGPEALPQIELLTKMQPRQWQQYIAAFQHGQELIRQQTIRDLKAQLALYRSYGRDIAKQILLGIRDENQPMRSELRRLVLSMFPELRVRAARTQPAAQRAQRQPQRRQPQQPRRTVTPPVHRRPGDFGGPGTTRTQQLSTTEYHDHYHESPITVHKEDIPAALRKLRFEHKNRPRTPRLRR